MKAIAVLKYAFTLVGAGLLVGALFLYQDTRSFLADAVETGGTVVNLEPVRGNDSKTTYRPVVQFQDQRGQSIQFSSSASSNPPSHAKGEAVRVLYRPDEPYEARLQGFFPLWGGTTIMAGLGAVFFLIGFGILVGGRMQRQREEALRQSGVPVETEFQGVELNTSLRVNGRHPFRVLTQWQNPTTSEIHVFHSGNLWFDPTKYLAEKRITVYMERGNPRRYAMDLSFLPKLAD